MKMFSLILAMLISTCVLGQDTSLVLPLESLQKITDFSKKTYPLNYSFSFQKASQTKIIPTNTISGIPSVDHLPSLFCKLEYKLESKSKLAPRFRLGSLNYTEWMEGKREFYMRYYK